MGKCVSCLHPKEKKNVLKEETPSNTEGTGETPPNTQRTGETPPSTSGTAEQTPPLVNKTPEETLPSTSGTAEQTPSLVKGRPQETPPSTSGTADQTPPLETERPEETPPSTSGTAEQTPSLLKEKPEETPPSTSGTAEKTPPLETEIPEETPPNTQRTGETPPSTSGTAEQTPPLVNKTPEETLPSTSERTEQTTPVVKERLEDTETPPSTSEKAEQTPPVVKERPEETPSSSQENQPVNTINPRSFTYQDLEAATQKFRSENFVGEGSFSRVHKGDIKNPDQIVAVKQLKMNGPLGDEEFLRELLVLSELRHQNLMELIGYCFDGDRRLLVYEYMICRSLDSYFLDIAPGLKPLTWSQRMNIALGVALGLQYLHEKVNPPILYRELKCSNILLGENLNAKLSNVGLAKLCPIGDNFIASSKLLGTYDYCAPECLQTGELSTKSDVYSFGVLMLEVIMGRKAVDNTKSPEESLVAWARDMFIDEVLADPRLKGKYPETDLTEAMGIAMMCVEEDPENRPKIADVVQVLSSLTPKKYDMSKSRRTIRPRPVEIGSQADG